MLCSVLFSSSQVQALDITNENITSFDVQSRTLTRYLRKTAGVNPPTSIYAYYVVEGSGTYVGYIPHVPSGDTTTHWFYRGSVPFYPGFFIEHIIEIQ